MMKIYVIGPVSNIENDNRPAFEQAAREQRIGGEERARELPWTGVLDASGNRIRVGDRVELFGIVGEAVFECGAYGIAFEDVIDWDAITGKIKERTGCDNRPDFCFNDNFISFWELLWNFNCDDDCCSVVERA